MKCKFKFKEEERISLSFKRRRNILSIRNRQVCRTKPSAVLFFRRRINIVFHFIGAIAFEWANETKCINFAPFDRLSLALLPFPHLPSQRPHRRFDQPNWIDKKDEPWTMMIGFLNSHERWKRQPVKYAFYQQRRCDEIRLVCRGDSSRFLRSLAMRTLNSMPVWDGWYKTVATSMDGGK